jgi:DUF2075 family protein
MKFRENSEKRSFAGNKVGGIYTFNVFGEIYVGKILSKSVALRSPQISDMTDATKKDYAKNREYVELMVGKPQIINPEYYRKGTFHWFHTHYLVKDSLRTSFQ